EPVLRKTAVAGPPTSEQRDRGEGTGSGRRLPPHIHSMSDTPTFAVRPSFLGIERSDPAAAICVAGIPYDLGTSNRPGARFGPTAIRLASRMLVDGDHPIAGAAPAAQDIADIGDFRIAHGDIAGTLKAIEAQAKPLKHLVALGGDHTLTLGRVREVVGDAPAYLTFDIDALDPAFAPGTGTPEIGGLFSWQAQAILRRLAGLRFQGMDVVEVSPPYDVAEITALAAATLAWEYL